MATIQQQQAFVANYGPYAQQAGSQLGVSPNVILGQWANESGWGVGGGAANQGNMAGITQAGGGYASYSSPQDFTNAYISTLQNPRYASALNTGSNSDAFVNGLYGGGYFTANPATYASNVSSNANTINTISNGGLLTANSTPETGLGGSTIYEGGTDPYSFSMDVTPNTATTQQTTTQGTSSGYGTGSNIAGDLGADVGYLPPAATGGLQATGLAPGVVSSISGWLSGAENWFGGIWDNTFGAVLESAQNWIVRGFLILVGVAILFIALWRLAAPDVSAGDVVKMAAA